MKIMVTYPPLISDKGHPTLGQNRQFQWFSNPSYLYPVVPAIAATLLKENDFDVIWKDAIAEQCTVDDYQRFFQTEKPDLVVIETKTPVVKRHWKIISELKLLSPETKFVLVGDHVTALPSESLRECPALDYVLTGGDYDVSLLQLAKHLRDGVDLSKGTWFRQDSEISNTGNFELTHDLDQLPFIDRDLTNWRLYREYNFKRSPYTYIMAGRDCPWHKCAFCAWTTLYPTFRVRSPENLLNEIGILVEKHGIREIFDDTGTFPTGGWLEKFCQGMIDRGYNKELYYSCNCRVDYVKPRTAKLMKKAGFRLLKMGLESANQNTLDHMNKGIKVEQIREGCKVAKEAGLEVHLTMMVGYPWETRDDTLRTLALAKDLMVRGSADILQATVVVPYPGTPFHQEALENDWFLIDHSDYDRYDMSEPVLKTPMSTDETMGLCNRIYKDIFLSPRYMARRLWEVRSLEDLAFTLKGAKAVFGHIADFSFSRK